MTPGTRARYTGGALALLVIFNTGAPAAATGTLTAHPATGLSAASQADERPSWTLLHTHPTAEIIWDLAATGDGHVFGVEMLGRADKSAPAVEHFDGKRWRTFSGPPVPSDLRLYTLNRVAATSGKNMWATGPVVHTGPSALDFGAVVARWNGTRWQRMALGEYSINDLALSGGKAWIAGRNKTGATSSFLRYFDKGKWKSVPKAPRLSSISPRTAKDIWGVSGTSSIVRYDGRTWHTIKLPKLKKKSYEEVWINQVLAFSRTNAFAMVSFVSEPAVVDGSALLHWNGHKWRRITLPGPRLGRMAPDGHGGIWTASARPGDTDLRQMLHHYTSDLLFGYRFPTAQTQSIFAVAAARGAYVATFLRTATSEDPRATQIYRFH